MINKIIHKIEWGMDRLDPERKIVKKGKLLKSYPIGHYFEYRCNSGRILYFKTLGIDKKNGDNLIVEFRVGKKPLRLTFNPKGQNIEALVREVSSTNIKINALLNQDSGEILGENSLDSFGKVEVFESSKGLKISSFCDEGINYKKKNEDRVVISPEEEFVAVVDGMGGFGNGDKAAKILAEKLLEHPSDPQRACNKALDNTPQGIGSVFVSAKIEREDEMIYVDETHVGDSGMIILDDKGKIVYVSKLDLIVTEQISQGLITKDEALYHSQRHILTDAVDHERFHKVNRTRVEVKKGYKVLLMSDGVMDNLTPDEIAKKLIKSGDKNSAKEILEIITERMSNRSKTILKTSNKERRKKGKYADGYKSEPKCDNRSFIVIDIN